MNEISDQAWINAFNAKAEYMTTGPLYDHPGVKYIRVWNQEDMPSCGISVTEEEARYQQDKLDAAQSPREAVRVALEAYEDQIKQHQKHAKENAMKAALNAARDYINAHDKDALLLDYRIPIEEEALESAYLMVSNALNPFSDIKRSDKELLELGIRTYLAARKR